MLEESLRVSVRRRVPSIGRASLDKQTFSSDNSRTANKAQRHNSFFSFPVPAERRDQHSRLTNGQWHLPHPSLSPFKPREEANTADWRESNAICLTLLFFHSSREKRRTVHIHLGPMPFPSPFFFPHSSSEKRRTLQIVLGPMAFPSPSFSHLSLPIQAERTDERCRFNLGQWHFSPPSPHSLICVKATPPPKSISDLGSSKWAEIFRVCWRYSGEAMRKFSARYHFIWQRS